MDQLGEVGVLGQVGPHPTTVPPHWNWHLLPAYVQRIAGGTFAGNSVTGYLWRHLGVPVEIALGLGLIMLLVCAISGTNVRTRSSCR